MTTIETEMYVTSDAARLSKKDIKNAKARAKRAAAKAAEKMNAEMQTAVTAKPDPMAYSTEEAYVAACDAQANGLVVETPVTAPALSLEQLVDELAKPVVVAETKKPRVKKAAAKPVMAAAQVEVVSAAEMADIRATLGLPAAKVTHPAKATAVASKPIKPKQAVLDLFYGDPSKEYSTKQAVAAIQAAHPGMNESSVRMWISDFKLDGTIKLVRREGLEVIQRAGKLGASAKGYVFTG